MQSRDSLVLGVMEVLDRMGREAPSADTDVFETGLLDSIGFVELLAELEQEFGCVFQLEDLEMDNFRSPRAIAACIEGLGGASRRPAESA